MAVKISKDEAHYRPASPVEVKEKTDCQNCTMFIGGGRCSLVLGTIDPLYLCDYYEAKSD